MITSKTCEIFSEACGTDDLNKSCVIEWHTLFKECQESMQDIGRSGCLKTNRSTENAKKVLNLICSDKAKASTLLLRQNY
jgi:hypothetical protein